MLFGAFILALVFQFCWPGTVFTAIVGWTVTIWIVIRTAKKLFNTTQPSNARSSAVSYLEVDVNIESEPADNTIPVFVKLRIQYEDREGAITTREIHTRAYNPDRGYITARCQLRKQERTFYIDNIDNAIVLDTGEVVTSKLRSYLRKHRQR